MKSLRKLKLDWARDRVAEGPSYRCQSFVSSLASVVGQRLRALGLTVAWSNLAWQRIEPLDDLGGYVCVRELEIDTAFLHASSDEYEWDEGSLVGCPSRFTLLANSRQAWERLTIHMAPEMEDFCCLRLLLRGFDGVGIATGAAESFPRPRIVRILLYQRLH